MSTTIETSPLVEQINAEHHACIESANSALDHAMRAGDLLIEAKVACKHGEWQAWLVDNFDGKVRTARLYMQLADNRYGIESKRQRDAVLSINEARRLIAIPQSVSDADGDDDEYQYPESESWCQAATQRLATEDAKAATAQRKGRRRKRKLLVFPEPLPSEPNDNGSTPKKRKVKVSERKQLNEQLSALLEFLISIELYDVVADEYDALRAAIREAGN
jgi:hypothetical protein